MVADTAFTGVATSFNEYPDLIFKLDGKEYCMHENLSGSSFQTYMRPPTLQEALTWDWEILRHRHLDRNVSAINFRGRTDMGTKGA
ncbi:hypothetical protein CEXT_52101 [Caerostris extrusa]|uniref:Uncharacterized protein n=1 Tax=Caerostris extrusa TaxID=172846 RepID=A0AAV4U6W4_CAEEX|nr:hypothetical protein CEXT_52101 [Caerostris extrusa]